MSGYSYTPDYSYRDALAIAKQRETIAALERCEQEGLHMADLAYEAVRLLWQREFTPESRASLAAGLIEKASIFAFGTGGDDVGIAAVAALAREFAGQRISGEDTATDDALHTAVAAAARAAPTPYAHMADRAGVDLQDEGAWRVAYDASLERVEAQAAEHARTAWAARQSGEPPQ